MIAFLILILLVGIERIGELVRSNRHLRISAANGGQEFGAGHYPAMVALHAALLIGAVTEVWLLPRPFLPWLGWPMLAIVVLAQGLRWWCILVLGTRWTTKIMVIPGDLLIRSGPYRWLRHPNYVAVITEGMALPLVHTAWLTATIFTVLNAWLLTVRIRTENRALTTADIA